MNDARGERHHVYAILSIACPLATVAVVLIVQTIVHADFWREVKQSEDGVQHVAGAMMFLSEFVEVLLFCAGACAVGLLLAVRSIKIRHKLTGIGVFSLLINGLPLLFIAILWISASLRSW